MIADVILMSIAFSGIVAGVIIGRHTYEELKSGEKYFILFKSLVLILLSVIFLLSIKRLSLQVLILFLLGFLIAHFLKYTYLFMGISAVVSIMTGNQLAFLPLIYLYGLPFGTIRYYHIRNHLKLFKILLVNFILFMLPLFLLFFDFDIYMLMAFSAGALIANIR